MFTSLALRAPSCLGNKPSELRSVLASGSFDRDEGRGSLCWFAHKEGARCRPAQRESVASAGSESDFDFRFTPPKGFGSFQFQSTKLSSSSASDRRNPSEKRSCENRSTDL